MEPFVQQIDGFDIIKAFTAIHRIPYSLLLDSADTTHPDGRYSFLACMPSESIEYRNGRLTITNRDQQTSFAGDPFDLLQQRMKAWASGTRKVEGLPPFQGGAAGLFGYDLARAIETLPVTAMPSPDMPDMAVGIYEQVIATDNRTQKSWVFTHARNEEEAAAKRSMLLKFIQHHMAANPPVSRDNASKDVLWSSSDTRESYTEKVREVIDLIKKGDIFQANISQHFSSLLPAGYDDYAHYLHLRQINPAPFAAYMNLGAIRIASASPERFLKLDKGAVETKPIKGTRPRSSNPQQDSQIREELLASAKDRAENTMIVDLLRNDLSRVCTDESIEVKSLCAIESFANVHHLVSTISATLRDDRSAIDLLKACFPGGSITGAPKIRAMEIIEEIEGVRRGPYCGSMGYIGFDGDMDTSILIRTLVYNGRHATLHAGGGITAQSDPDAEYQETLDKAGSVLKSFAAAEQQNVLISNDA